MPNKNELNLFDYLSNPLLAKIFDFLDQRDQVSLENTCVRFNDVLHPFNLLPHELLALIFDYLDLESLEKAGQVCRRFREEANFALRLRNLSFANYQKLMEDDYKKQVLPRRLKQLAEEDPDNTENASVVFEQNIFERDMEACLKGNEKDVINYYRTVKPLVESRTRTTDLVEKVQARLDNPGWLRNFLAPVGLVSLVIAVPGLAVTIYLHQARAELALLGELSFGLVCFGSTAYLCFRKKRLKAKEQDLKKLEEGLSEKSPLLANYGFFSHTDNHNEKGRKLMQSEIDSETSKRSGKEEGDEEDHPTSSCEY